MRSSSLMIRLLLAATASAVLVFGIAIISFLLRDPHIPKAYLVHQPFDQDDLQKMRGSRVRNMDAVLAAKGLLQTQQQTANQPSTGATVAHSQVLSPYEPTAEMGYAPCQEDAHCRYFSEQTHAETPQYPARQDVMQWWNNRRTQNAEQTPVCALAFEDAQHMSYRLRTFANTTELRQHPNYHLTHYQACGACSTLQDLAVYAELDLTNMASKCSKLLGREKKQQCMQEGIGFTPACAKVWTYNAERSAQYCKAQCIEQYGLWALLTDTEERPADMSLATDLCLHCDAMVSEPGFQYAAGRSRRNSGIASEILRNAAEVYPVTHGYWHNAHAQP